MGGQILDWMFKPNYAASLDILKVEIGASSTSMSPSSLIAIVIAMSHRLGCVWFAVLGD